MRRKRKAKLAPMVPPTQMDGIDAIRELQALSDEALDIELVNATNTESWMRTFAASYKGEAKGIPEGDQLVNVMRKAADYSRVARETIAIILFLRSGEEQGGKDENGKSGPKGYL